MTPLRVWLCGQKSFGVAVLKALVELDDVEVVGVTAPLDDKLEEETRRVGLSSSTLDLEPEYLRGIADLIVNAHGHALIRRDCREAVKFGAIGYHPSLLPRHRGRDAIKWTVELQDKITGGTVYILDDGFDTGPIISQSEPFTVEGRDASTLWRDLLFPLGVQMLTRVVRYIGVRGMLPPTTPQYERHATYEPPWEERDNVYWQPPAGQADAVIRDDGSPWIVDHKTKESRMDEGELKAAEELLAAAVGLADKAASADDAEDAELLARASQELSLAAGQALLIEQQFANAKLAMQAQAAGPGDEVNA